MARELKWDSKCRLGIKAIDAQHRLLFAIANELLDIEGPKEQAPEIGYLFYHLADYVKRHFKEEEGLFRKHDYPERNRHEQSHRKIIAELQTVMHNTQDIFTTKGRLEGLLRTWIHEHILIEDKKFVTWMKSKGLV